MRVIITGAAGRIGREIVEELLSFHDLCLLDRRPVPGHKSMITDLGRQNSKEAESDLQSEVGSLWWAQAFEGAEVVIHLAEDPNPDSTWERVLLNNIQATWNVFQAAIAHRVRSVVYASSNFAVKALERELAPSCYEPDGPKIDSNAGPSPINPYGIGKACGEITGRALVAERKLVSFTAVRIGWYDPSPPKTEGYYRLAIGQDDLRSLFRRCVEAEFEGFHVVYGVSAQKISPYDLSYTRQLLSWEPKQYHDR